MLQIVRIIIILAHIVVYQNVRSKAAVSGNTTDVGTRYNTCKPLSLVSSIYNLKITRADSHQYILNKYDFSYFFAISNKYRSDKKEYRVVFNDRTHHMSSSSNPAMDLPAQLLRTGLEAGISMNDKPEAPYLIGRRE
jgi:hypothetical protein